MRITPAQLATAAAAMSAAAGTTPSGGTTARSRWSDIAVAAETATATSSSSNTSRIGYMLRAAVALETASGTSGAEENTGFYGTLKRIVDALEAVTSVTSGSLGARLAAAATAWTGGGGVPAPTAYYPTLLAQPLVTAGTITQGDTISAGSDLWANEVGTVAKSYQWYRGRTAIAGATNSTYVVQAADVGHKLRCFVTATNAKGSWTAFTPFSQHVVTDAAATHKVSFGAKTRSGHGGYPLGSAITVTGGANSADWTVNAANELVPSGTYGAAKTFAASSYTLTMSDASTVHITMIANRFSVAANSADTTSSFQLRNILLLSTGVPATEVQQGDEIHCRAATLNPTGSDYRVRIRAAAYAGAGRIAIWGLNCPRLSIDSTLSGEVLVPWDFWDCAFYDNVTSGGTSPLLAYAPLGGGVGAYDTTFEFGPAIANIGDRYGFRSRNNTTVQRCTFRNIGKALTQVNTSPAPYNVDDCTFREIYEDCFNSNGEGASSTYARNLIYDKKEVAGAHADPFQHTGFIDGASHDFGTVEFNLLVRNEGTPGFSGGNGTLFADDSHPNDGGSYATRRTGAVIRNNLALVCSTNGIALTRFDAPEVLRNTQLFDFQADAGTYASKQTRIRVDADKGGAGGSFTGNLTNIVPEATTAGQTGATFAGNKAVTAESLPAYQAALAAFTNSGLNTRSAIHAALSPLVGGTARNTDGTYAGALLPNGCWNMGEVF